ncbi:hypothetical protein [Actinomadura kijaniata]|uniref:hypothetical protein n=1 Tax=Actinomadura kijaniata TaxID=46161 RepID=UPI00082FF495|nr:hypothetical protein [Actinomadura kijaniata]
MDEQEREGARLLGGLRGFEPPAAGGDLAGRAVRAGRRGARRRRALGAAASAAAISGVAVVSVLAGREMLAPSPEPAAGRFTEGRQEFLVGRAGGFAPIAYDAGADVQRITLRPERPNTSPRADALVEMYPKGALPAGLDAPPSGSAAPDVHGRPARWLASPVLRTGAVEMAWEWRPGAWGFVSLKGAGAERERARLVALSVVPRGTPGITPTGGLTPSGDPSPSGSPTGSAGPTGQARP